MISKLRGISNTMANMAESAENSVADEIKVRRVPDSLVEFLRSRIIQYLERTENLSAEIHEVPGQSAKLVLRGGETEDETVTTGQDDKRTTNTILVRNVPSSIDEDMLEVFFESKKKGGGPVSNIKLNRQMNWAEVEFSDADAVERILSKTPVKLMSTECDICPYVPLLQGNSLIQSLEFCTIHKELTEDLLALHVEEVFRHVDLSSTEYETDEKTSEDEKLINSREETTKTQQTIEGSVENRIAETVKQTITWLKPIQLRMLQAINYLENSTEQFLDIKVKISLDKKKITCEGAVERVNYYMLKLLKTIGEFGFGMICNVPTSYIQLYRKERVIKYINDRLKAQNCICEWEVEGQMLMVCSSEADISTCTEIIVGNIKETRFEISKESSATFFSAGWQEEQKEIEKNYDVIYNVISGQHNRTEVCVITTPDASDKVVTRVKEFLKQQLKVGTERFSSNDGRFSMFGSLCNLSKDLAHKVLDLIIKDVSLHYDVAVEKCAWQYDYDLTGTQAGREVVKRRLRTLDL